MRKYHMSGVEHVHMMRHVPRSYDMTRTHVMHQGVNKHVDVVLRSSPKYWKTKKVRVSVVKNETQHNVIRIRAHANKGYVAVRKVTNEKYEADRRKVVTAYETKYAAPSANNRALVHDLKSQLSAMAKRSADYIDSQLGSSRLTVPYARSKPQQKPAAVPQNKPEAPLPPFPKLPDEPVSATMLSPETEAILKKGGYKRPKPLSSTNPYASDYSRQTSDWEYRSLMASLERSLDEACSKYVVDEPKQADADGGVSLNKDGNAPDTNPDFNLNITEQSEIYAQPVPEEEPSEYSADMDRFEPALDFSAGGEHYIPEDELFDRDFSAPDDDFALPTSPEQEGSFDASRFFTEDEEEFIPPPTDYDGRDDFALPTDYAAQEEVVLPQGYGEYEEEPVNFNPYPADEEEEAYVPPTIFPEEEEEFAPPTVFPEDEEDFVPPTIFPEEEEYVPVPPYPEDDGGYSPAPVSPDRNEYWEDGDYSTTVQSADARQTETFFSRTGGQIKKAIGVIRGHGGSSKKNGSDNMNNNVEITYSDRNG